MPEMPEVDRLQAACDKLAKEVRKLLRRAEAAERVALAADKLLQHERKARTGPHIADHMQAYDLLEGALAAWRKEEEEPEP